MSSLGAIAQAPEASWPFSSNPKPANVALSTNSKGNGRAYGAAPVGTMVLLAVSDPGVSPAPRHAPQVPSVWYWARFTRHLELLEHRSRDQHTFHSSFQELSVPENRHVDGKCTLLPDAAATSSRNLHTRPKSPIKPGDGLTSAASWPARARVGDNGPPSLSAGEATSIIPALRASSTRVVVAAEET